ncbi:helix-turn-helix domain-containing protein [Dyella sp. Tek66A03]|uniref:helix-turn-helix domain-containing protein n=1 Tax=Dyella sp. Tek66A03 TaxID=3458298 RepID=UPI00403ED8A3
MKLDDRGNGRFAVGSRMLNSVDFPSLHVEHWHLEPGRIGPRVYELNEVHFVTSGRSFATRIRSIGTQKAFIQPGVACIGPVGVSEIGATVNAPIDILSIYLPQSLIDRSALTDYDVDPAKIELVYAGGLRDPMLYQIAVALGESMERGFSPADRLFVDGMQAALAGHLLGNYSIDRWHPPSTAPDLDPKKLKRVLDLIEIRFTEQLPLCDLAAEACLSEFHFSRLFHLATGLSPHRYVTRRRVQAAERLLAHTRASLLQIALETGFGSQANFIRAFRKSTGLTPGQYRAIQFHWTS